MTRPDGRANDELRPTKITCGVQVYPEGSVLIETGLTRVLCAVSVEEQCAPLPARLRAGLGDGRVRDASALHRDADSARTHTARPHTGDTATYRQVVARRR